jgi:ferredoxin-nitrate reductase
MKTAKNNSYKSTCSYCGVGCGVTIHKDRNNKVIVEGDKDHPANKGILCSKGMNLHYVVSDKTDRILYPEMRWNRNMPKERVSWEAGLERAAAVFKTMITKYGPESVGFYVSGQCLTEEYYIVNKLVKGFLGSNNIDTNSRLCMSSAVVGYKMSLGEDAVPISYDDIELADCFFITGANPAWCHPVIFRRLEAHKAANPNIKIIVADPRKTQSCSIADIHLQLKPGTDIILNHALARVIIENNLVDKEFIANHTEGYQEFWSMVMEKTVEEAAEQCDVPADLIRKAGNYIGRAGGFMSMWAMGLNQSVVGVNKNLSLINLSLITGQIGKPGAGPFSLTGQPNAMGGREVGGLSNLLPAHRDLGNPKHREEVANFWGVPSIPEKPGLTATEMFDSLLSGKMKAIWIICTNPLVSLPDARNAEVALRNAKFVVVQDISHKSDTAQYADLLLPAAGWLEKDGTMTNSDRRISYLNKVIDPPGEALSDVEILCRFAKKMGFGKFFDFKNSAEIFKEYCEITRGTNIDISGLDYTVLEERRSVQWPFPEGNTEDTPRLFTDKKFYTPSGRARIHTVPDENQSEPINQNTPLILTTGRIRDQWHTMTKTGKVMKLTQHIDKPFLEIHEIDAVTRGIRDGDVVEILNARGKVKVTAKISPDIKQGVVFLPMHWGKILNKDFGRANNITNNLYDPKSKEPDFKFSAVQVRKFFKKKQKVIVVGAGAAAFQFVKTYRELNENDELHVFSKEIYPFYNRVMLPEYISGKQEWERLVKMKEEEAVEMNIRIHKGMSIIKIDREVKKVTDSHGTVHDYDLLILATGSRAAKPKDVPSLDGIFTMRHRIDADEFKKMVKPGSRIIIVGGGLLGLELADALKELNAEVNIVQRTSRLMDRQLDTLASALLHEEVNDRGIKIFYNDEVLSHAGQNKITGVRLKSGKNLACDSIVYAIGTQPNIEIAKEAGIACNRGVIVNDYLQTNDPDIFAFGEIAEHKKSLYGITAAAEEQANIAARFINGDEATFYTGSLSMNILKVSGLNLCSIGLIDIPEDNPDYEEVVYIDKTNRYYKKCIVYQDRLVGAILMGDKSEFNEFKDLIKNKIELSDKRLALLLSSNGAKRAVLGELVCSCNNVGEGNIVEAIESGCRDFSSLCKTTGAGTGCGSCRPEVKALLDKNMEEVSLEQIVVNS